MSIKSIEIITNEKLPRTQYTVGDKIINSSCKVSQIEWDSRSKYICIYVEITREDNSGTYRKLAAEYFLGANSSVYLEYEV